MKFKTDHFKHYRITAITFVLLALGFLIYFFGYVKSNESYLNERAFRILSQIDENISVKYRTTLINARREAGYLTLSVADTMPPEKTNFLAGFTLHDKKGVFNKNLHFSEIKFISLAQAKPAIKQSRLVGTSNGWLLSIKDTSDVRNELSAHKAIKTDTAIIYFQSSTGVSDFVSPLLAPSVPEVFDEFVLFYDTDTLLKAEESAEKRPDRFKTVYETFTSGFTHQQLNDSLVNQAQEIVIGGSTYKVFVQPVSMGKIQGLVLCGLMKAKRYQAEVFSIPMFTIIVMLLIVILLALGYPFLKLFIMSQWERVRSIDAFFTVCSLIVGSFLLTLLLFSMYEQIVSDSKSRNKDLVNLSDSISYSLITELKSIALQLNAYKNHAESEMSIFSHKNILNGNTADPLFPTHYPYLIDAFWIDRDGYSRVTWTTQEENAPAVNVGDRNYFKDIMNDRAWYLPLSDTSSIKYSFMPIFDRITGKNLAVISTGNNIQDVSNQKLRKPVVLAIETELYSVVNPVLPLGYGFCILDDSGNIWFHSDRRKNLQENFIKECKDNTLLQSALLGNSNTHLNIKYNGKDYQAYVSQIQHMPLHLIVFHNKDYSKTTSSLTITLSFLCYLICLFPLCVLLAVQKFSYVSDFRLRGENSPFAWLRPNSRKPSAYKRLSCILISLLGLLTIYFIYPYQAVCPEKSGVYQNGLPFLSTTILIHALTAIYSFLAAHLLLSDEVHLQPFRKFMKKINYRFFLFFLILVILINLYLSTINVSSEFWLIVIYQILLLGIILSWSLVKNFPVPNYITVSFSYLTKNYLAFLSLWILIIGVFPAVSFYKEIYNYEQRIATEHYLMKLAQDLTKRRNHIQDTYRDIQFNAAKNSLLNSLLFAKGNFSQSSYHSTFRPVVADISKASFSDAFTHMDQFAHLLRNEFLYNPVIVENQHLSYPVKSNSRSHQFTFIKDANNFNSAPKCMLKFEAFNPGKPKQEHLILQADTPHFWSRWFIQPVSIVFFLMIWTTFLYLLFSLCRYAVFRLFNLGIIDENYLLPNNFKQMADEILAHKKNVFLTGLYLAEHNNFISRYVHANPHAREVNISVIKPAAVKDLADIALTTPRPRLIIISYFDHLLFYSPNNILHLLEEIEKLLVKNHMQLLLVSQKDPAQISQFFLESADKEKNPDEKILMMELMNRWHKVLRNFHQQFYHININYRPAGHSNGKVDDAEKPKSARPAKSLQI